MRRERETWLWDAFLGPAGRREGFVQLSHAVSMVSSRTVMLWYHFGFPLLFILLYDQAVEDVKARKTIEVRLVVGTKPL
jgi:hypothetical protein